MTAPLAILRTSVASIALAITAILPGTAAAQSQMYAIDTVAATGDVAPGTGQETFSSFSILSSGGEFAGHYDLNDAGEVIFGGLLNTAYLGSNTGVWFGTPGNLALVAREGDPIPGAEPGSYDRIWYSLINSLGQFSSYGRWSPNGLLFEELITLGSVGNLETVALTVDQAPGTAGLTFGRLFPSRLNDQGQVLFRALLDTADSTLQEGIWIGDTGSLAPVAITGDEAPDAPGFTFQTFHREALNKTGVIAFLGKADRTNPSNDEGIWVGPPDALTLVARTGDAAPGLPGRIFLHLEPAFVGENVFGPVLNGVGEVAFRAILDSSDRSTDEGIWLQSGGSLRLAVLEGDPAPGTPGLNFREFDFYQFNELGQLAFLGRLDQSNYFNETGIWMGLPDQLALVARQTEVAPGTGGQTFAAIGLPHLNGSGQVAFFGNLRSDFSQYGLWAGGTGDLALVALEGDAIEVRPGDFRTIKRVDSPSVPLGNGGRDGRSKLFNNAGQLAFTVRFTDGSEGLFRASPLPVSQNQAPVANAGPDRTVGVLQTVILDGSGSLDPDRTIMSFTWSLDGTEIGTGPTPTVGPFASGNHTITLTVTDRGGASATDTMVLAVINAPPVADAGPDQTANHVQTVALDGTGSADPEGGVLTYAWSLDGSHIATGPTATVGPFAVGIHTITLTVTDDQGASATDTMVVTVVNAPPLADAGPDQTANHVQTVALDGTGSADPEGGVLTYAWNLDGVEIATGPSPSVGPFPVGSHAITLTVTDDQGASASDTMVLTVVNAPPLADAGPDQTANHVQTVALDGTGSADPEGGVLAYAWSLDGVEIATEPSPSVGPFPVGSHAITLTVTDDQGASAADTMIVTVVNAPPLADAGPDQTANHVQTVVLDGAGSADPEGGVLAYAWSLDGVEIATEPSPSVGPFPVGSHAITLTVTDDQGASAADTMVVTVVNAPPVADAGPDQTVSFTKGKTTLVTLDGSASSDPEGAIVSYVWSAAGQTVGSGEIVQVELTKGVYTFVLTDDQGATSSDSVVVTATKGPKTSSL